MALKCTSSHHTPKLITSIASLFDVNKAKSRFSDVRIKVGSRTFYCHKLVLQIGSEYLAAKFLRESETETVESVDANTFYSILQFMYTGDIQLSSANIESILLASDILLMDDLKKVCFRFLDDSLDIERVSMYWRLGHKYKLPGLREQCLNLATRDITEFSARPRLLTISDTMMREMFAANQLQVKSEVEVCYMMMNWLRVQTEEGNEVHPEHLLPLIRWSGIGVHFISEKLLENPILKNDSLCKKFLTKVIRYKLSDIQFEGLQTFHRPSTGVESCLLAVGLDDGVGSTNEVVRVSLQQADSVTTLRAISTKMRDESAIGVFTNTVYVTGIGDSPRCQAWKWDTTSNWIRCSDMLNSRRRHCVAVVDPMLYVVGGLVAEKTTSSSVEKYNTITNTWSLAGYLNHACQSAACVSYRNLIFVFGGTCQNNKPLDYVQIYNPATETCTLSETRMPRADHVLRAVLWETSVILMGKLTCSIYNFETNKFQTRQQFKADENIRHFGLVLDNEMVYFAGGGVTDSNGDWKCSDEIKCVSVFDIIEDKPATWKHHAKLPKPSLIQAFALVCLKRGQ